MGQKKQNKKKCKQKTSLLLFSKLVQDQLSMADFQIITSSMVAECLKM